jgi:hypothetical protein
MSFRSRWIRILFQALGVALFILILSRVDLREIGRSYRTISPAPAAAGIALLFVLTFLKALRWRTIVSGQGVEVGVWRAFRIYAASLFLGVVTPGHLGDFAKSLYLSNRGLSAGRALMSSVADRLFDLILLFVIAFASLVFFPGLVRNQILLGAIFLAAAAAAVAAFFFRRDILARLVKRFVSAMPGERFRGSLDRAVTEGLDGFPSMIGGRLGRIVALTLAAWTAHYAYFVIFAAALGVGAPVSVIVVCVSAAIVASLVPVSISGLGTRDLVIILIFARAGLGREAAVAFSFSFILSYLVLGVTGLLCWITAPFDGERVPPAAGAVIES